MATEVLRQNSPWRLRKKAPEVAASFSTTTPGSASTAPLSVSVPEVPQPTLLASLQTLTAGLSRHDLFPCINLKAVQEAGVAHEDLSNAKALRPILESLSHCGLKAAPGFNPSSGHVTLAFTIPEATAYVDTPANAVAWMMLGCHPHQAQLEAHNTLEHRGQDRHIMSFLANKCLEHFMAQTHLGISEKQVHLHLRRITITLQSARKGVTHRASGMRFADDMEKLFWYSPSYTRLSGYNPADGTYSAAALAEQQTHLLDEMMHAFWGFVHESFYYPCKEVEDTVTREMSKYLRGALGSAQIPLERAMFAPKRHSLKFFLQGSAGTGKSSFVVALSAALQRLVHVFLNPSHNVSVVKLPLNSIHIDDLRKELFVRGISDWSVERMIEQRFAKDHMVIFHLEELPKDVAIQEEIYTMIQKMIGQLRTNYPKQADNLVYVYTSNYEAAGVIARVTIPMKVVPPTYEMQTELCTKILESDIRKAWSQDIVKVTLHAPPPHSPDMRPLEKWRMCMSHLVARYVEEQLAAVNIKPSDLSGAAIQSNGTNETQTVTFRLATPVDGDKFHMVEIEPLVLHSNDGFFWYASGRTSNVPLPATLSAHDSQCLQAVVSMSMANLLKPAVIVLKGSAEKTAALQEAIQSYFRGILPVLKETSVSVHSLEDQDVVLGSPWDFPRGGLFKFIDDITNPCSTMRSSDGEFGAIYASVNETGQYVVRELLESHQSQTHRQTIRKNQILFVLRVDPESKVTSTIMSRAHLVINCNQ